MTENNRWWESYLVRYLAGNIFAVLVLFYLVGFHGDAMQKSVCPEVISTSTYSTNSNSKNTCSTNSESKSECAINSESKNICTTHSESKSVCTTEPEKTSTTKAQLKLCESNNFSGEVFGFIFITTKVIESAHDKTAFKDSDFISNTDYESHRIKITEINFANIFILGVFGFLYMYVSSLFIYVLHILRGAWSYPFRYFDNKLAKYICDHLRKLGFERDKILKKLDDKFVEDKDFSPEYITSYKHMREHGNAFGVILMEILFAKFLIIFSFSIWAIVIWLFIGFLGWFLGTYLESKIV